jgi:phosphoglycerol transferase MdoB-like AlkP superfamily enzyme
VDDLKHWSFSAVKPVGYDSETARELSKSASTGFSPGNDQQVRPNVIFLLVESLIDLRDIGLDVSPDPQPFLHSVRGNGHDGVAIVSNICSGSSTTEFELLSGMEARMWPYPPIPYYSLRSRSINSIPRRWTDQSFSAAVMQVDPRNMYNRVLSYEKMGIGSVEWISEGAGTIGSDSGTGVGEALPGSAMDTILLNKMAEYVEEEDRPAFVFGFTNGTHSPYDGSEGNWSVSSGVVSDGIIASEIAGYCDEIVVADSLCKQFWERLKALDEHTVLVIVGDHMPPFRSRVGPYGVVSDDEYHLRLVPYVVLDTKVGAVAVPPRISTNMIPWWVMKYCGISFTDAFANVSLRALESSTVVSGGKTADRVVGDYRFLQYGILEDGIESVPAQEN